MNGEMILWLVLFVTFLVVEVITVGLTSIWFAVGALFALVAAGLEANVVIQIILFVVSSIILMIATKPFLSKYLLKNREKTNYESVIGQKAKVTEQISNIENKGTVMINGLEWSAKSENDEVFEPGVIVEVVKVEGVKVIVK